MENPAEQTLEYPYYEATVTETTWHFKVIQYLEAALRYRFRDAADVFVGANNFVYWEEGNTDEKQAPDVYVCFGARNIDRSSYKSWDEGGVVPQVIFEITSKSSRWTDLGTKKAVYESLGVEEYYVFDPLAEYIPHCLRAFRLKNGSFEEVTPRVIKDPARPLRVFSPRLGLDMETPEPHQSGLLRLYAPGSSEGLPTYEEARLLAAAETARANAESARANAESARADLLAAKLRKLGLDAEGLE